MPAFSEDDEKNTGTAGTSSSQTKEKVKIRNTTTSTVTTTSTQQHQQQQQHHSNINMANIANANITTVPITADSASLASQGINVCRRLLIESLFESLIKIQKTKNDYNPYIVYLVEFFSLHFDIFFLIFII